MIETSSDRRDGRRASFSGKATITHAGSREPAELGIRDLSTGGARLVGRVQLLEGEPIRVSLEIDGIALSIAAKVVRTDPQNAQVAIAFSALPPEALEMIERAVATLIETVRACSAPTVLILSDNAETRAALERDLAQLGRAARPCATPLEAMWLLQDPMIHCEAVVISSNIESEPLGELLKHFAEHHPRLRRLLLFGDHLKSLDHGSSSRVDAVLRTPLRIRALARALGIRETDSSVAMLPMTESEP